VAIVGKVVSVSLASVAVGERPNTAVKSGFAMAQIGAFSILFALAAGKNATGSLLYSLAVALTAITSVVCPLMVRVSNPVADWVDRHVPMPVQNALSRYGAWLERVRITPESEGTKRGGAG